MNNSIDLFAKITSCQYFKNNFTSLEIIKESSSAISGKSYFTKLKKKCFLKVKNITDNDTEIMTIYTILKKNNMNKYVNKIYDITIECNLVFIAIEFIEGTNLVQYLDNNEIDDKSLRNILIELIEGLDFIHSLDIIHGDIKLENIMIHNEHVKIIDFDLSKLCINKKYIQSSILSGTQNYFAPETYDLCIYSKMSDVWSLGIVLYKLITYEFPYKFKLNRLYHMRIANNFKFLDIDKLKSHENRYGKDIIDTVINMLQFKDIDRKMVLNNNNDK